MSAFTPATNLRPRFLPRAKYIVVIATLFGMESAWASFGGNSFGDGFAIILGLIFVTPPLLVAVLVGAFTPNRRYVIMNAIIAATTVCMMASVLLNHLVLLRAGLFGAVVGLVGGVLVWLWRKFWSGVREKKQTRNSKRLAGADPSPPATAALERPQPAPRTLWRDEVRSWLRRSSAWGRRADTTVVKLGADLKSTGLAHRLGSQPALWEKLGYSAMLIFAGLALSPIILMDLIERVAESSGSSWLTAPLVAIANARPLLDVAPAALDVLAAALVGPWWGAGVMLVTTGLLSPYFDGYPSLPYASVFGVMIAGLAYRATGKVLHAVLGEIVGAGVIGAIFNAAIGIYATDTTFDWPGWVGLRLLPTCIGAVLGGFALVAMRRAE